MAEHFYAYLPVLMKQMYEGVSDDFLGWEVIVDPLFIRGVADSEKAVIVQEIDRFLSTHSGDRELLEQVWVLGARDFPSGPIREALQEVRTIVQRSRLKIV